MEATKIWWGAGREAYWGDFFHMWGDDRFFETYCSETYSSEPTKFTQWLTGDSRLHKRMV